MHAQTLLRWHTHRPVQAETAWMDLLSSAVPDVPWGALALHQGNTALTLIARSAEGSAWLNEHVAVLSRAVMRHMGGVITMEPLERFPGIRHGGGRVFTYEAATVALVKSGPWAPLNGEGVDDATAEKLAQRFKKQVLDLVGAFTSTPEEAARLSDLSSQVDLRLVSPGRPMPVRVALPLRQGGPRAERLVLCRVGMVFESAWRFEGDFSVGKLTGLGYGRTFRGDVLAAAALSQGAELEGAL